MSPGLTGLTAFRRPGIEHVAGIEGVEGRAAFDRAFCSRRSAAWYSLLEFAADGHAQLHVVGSVISSAVTISNSLFFSVRRGSESFANAAARHSLLARRKRSPSRLKAGPKYWGPERARVRANHAARAQQPQATMPMIGY